MSDPCLKVLRYFSAIQSHHHHPRRPSSFFDEQQYRHHSVKHRTTDRQRTDTLPRPSRAKTKEGRCEQKQPAKKKTGGLAIFFVDNPDCTFIPRSLFFSSLFFFFSLFSSSPPPLPSLLPHSHNGLPPCCFPPPWPRQGKPHLLSSRPLPNHIMSFPSSIVITIAFFFLYLTFTLIRFLIPQDDLLSQRMSGY